MFECYEYFKDYISNRIALLRSSKNVSAREMSLSIGQSENYINTIENKKSLPRMEGFYYICEYFNIEPKDFFDTGVDNPEKLKEIIEDLKALNDEQLKNIASIIKGLKK